MRVKENELRRGFNSKLLKEKELRRGFSSKLTMVVVPHARPIVLPQQMPTESAVQAVVAVH